MRFNSIIFTIVLVFALVCEVVFFVYLLSDDFGQARANAEEVEEKLPIIYSDKINKLKLKWEAVPNIKTYSIESELKDSYRQKLVFNTSNLHFPMASLVHKSYASGHIYLAKGNPPLEGEYVIRVWAVEEDGTASEAAVVKFILKLSPSKIQTPKNLRIEE